MDPEISSNPEVSLNPEDSSNPEVLGRVTDFEQQVQRLVNLMEGTPAELPVIERLGLSNSELIQLEIDLGLPYDNQARFKENPSNPLSSEAQIQAYVDYLAKRTVFEQTKETLQKNQLALRSTEETYKPDDKTLLMHLLGEQAILLDQLKSQKQALLKVQDQASYEALLQQKYVPSASLSTIETSQKAFSSTAANLFQVVDKPNNTAPIPVGLPCPEGLVFRVQVGAFRKPVPAERFREFTPVDGQVLANGLTVYMAGYFSSSAEALQQQKRIRTLGYTDAFVLAYQNCTRMSLAQGRALEPKTADINTIDLAQQSKFAGPGQGLYYTVQVGVYNRPLRDEAQIGLTQLIEARTAKGQYRYASGKFANLDEAKIRQRLAVTKGITDAFIVAYYQGKRIDLAQAKLLVQSGVVCQTIEPTANPVLTPLQQQQRVFELPDTKTIALPDPVYRFELKCTDCIDALTRFNRVGVFVYDDQKELIVSALQKESQWNLVQQMYLKEMRKRSMTLKGETQTRLLDNELEGAFVDWLLRQHNGYELYTDEQSQWVLRYLNPAP